MQLMHDRVCVCCVATYYLLCSCREKYEVVVVSPRK
jgi:hypothetical protein